MEQKNKIIIRLECIDTLYKIIDQMAAVSISSAETLERQFEEFLLTVQEYPNIFPKYDDAVLASYDYHKAVIGRFFFVLYRVVGNEIIIRNIVDCRKNNEWLRDESFVFHDECDTLMHDFYYMRRAVKRI